MSVYEQIEVDAPPQGTVRALRDALRARAIAEYAVVDHGHDMHAAGVPSHPAWTLVFGIPRQAKSFWPVTLPQQSTFPSAWP